MGDISTVKYYLALKEMKGYDMRNSEKQIKRKELVTAERTTSKSTHAGSKKNMRQTGTGLAAVASRWGMREG